MLFGDIVSIAIKAAHQEVELQTDRILSVRMNGTFNGIPIEQIFRP